MVVSDRDRERCSQGIFRASCLAGPHVPALPTNQVPVAYGGVGWGGEGRVRSSMPRGAQDQAQPCSIPLSWSWQRAANE